jgi:hypothetical protein
MSWLPKLVHFNSSVPNISAQSGATTMGTRSYRFGEFRLEAKSRMQLCGSTPIALSPKAIDTLVVLPFENVNADAAQKFFSDEESTVQTEPRGCPGLVPAPRTLPFH